MPDAEAGEIPLISKRGTPANLAAPLYEYLLRDDIHRVLALLVLESTRMIPTQADKAAGLVVASDTGAAPL